MGRGKSTAAIHYINKNKGCKRFMYVTPLLSEVARIRDACGLEEPNERDDKETKTADLRSLIHQGKGISTTHALFELMDDDLLDVVREKHYTLIIDEAVTAIEKAEVTTQDRAILDGITTADENGIVSWIDHEYTGKFDDYKKMADRDTLYRVDNTFVHTFNLKLLTAFDEVFLLTYLFEGSVLDAYFQCFKIKYDIWGIGGDLDRCMFIPEPDSPPPIDYRPLVHIVDNQQMNEIGDPFHALAKNWYRQRSYHDADMIQLRRNMTNFFKNITRSKKDNRVFTCFKDYYPKLIPDNGSYGNNFVQMMARATNDYAGCFNLAYMVNRFEDPNLMKFLANMGRTIDRDQCALSDMLQWIWRSAIRNGQDINLYIPSRRMRGLLTDWMDREAEGGAARD